MNILIVCPVYRRFFDVTVRSIFSLRPVDGGRLDAFFPWEGYGDGQRDSRDIIADKYNAARLRALEGGYDAMLCIESDMIVPNDAAQKLAATGAAVAYGAYVFRRKPFHWNAYSVMLPEKKMSGYPLSNVPERARLDWGGVVEVDGVGLGCTLIRRRVLEKVSFRSDGGKHADGSRSHCDWYFSLDVTRRGYKQKCDLSVLCGHITPQDRDGNVAPSVLWPDINAPEFVRVEPFAYD
jgi:hypothetical protein